MNKLARTHFYATPGWLNPEEAVLLFFVAEKANPHGVAVEIGSFVGKSSGIIASVSDRLVCIDPWEWAPSEVPPHHRPKITDLQTPLYRQFLSNVKAFPNILPIRGRSQDVIPTISDPVGLVFIDADHRYEPVRADILLALSLHPHYLALHDYADPAWPGVKRAADELLGWPDYLAGRLGVWVV